jgi:RNA polymerase sigma-70 factor (ECF subfamily)
MTATPPQPAAEDRLALWVREHGRAVRGYLLGMVGCHETADDLAQEVFRRAWEARHRYEETGHARAYLLRVADRLACDRARKAGRELTVNEDDWRRLEPASDELPPHESVAQAETRRELAAALECLSLPQRRVLLLRYYGDCSFQEIADAMETPLNTVLSHCRRGLLALRKLLVEDSS